MNTEMETWMLMQEYIRSLDWFYILSFILFASLLNSNESKKALFKITGFKAQTRYRTTLFGVGYAIVVFLIRGSKPDVAEELLRSFLFTLVFHKLIVDRLNLHLGLSKTKRKPGADPEKDYYSRFKEPLDKP